MPATPSIRVGFETLRFNPLRTMLSTLGVIMGVASLVAVLALGDGMERFARDQIERTTSLQAVAVRPQAGRSVDGVFVPDTAAPMLTTADAAAIDALPGVREILLTVEGAGLVSRRGGAPRGAYVTGVLGGSSYVARAVPAHGRALTVAEMRSGASVAVLTDRLARLLASGADVRALVGDTVTMQGRPVMVVGVLPEGAGAPMPAAYLPFAAAQALMVPSRAPRVPQLVAMVDSAEAVLRARGAIEAWVARAHPEWKDRVTVATNESRARQLAQGILLFKLFMGAITGISLLVGGIGIMNVLLAAVAERTREIGIRRAAGARRRDILVQFLSESVAITSLGSVIGFALGLGGALAATAVMRQVSQAQMYAAFSWGTLLVTAVAAVSVGLLFGTYPAMRAARLSPIEAIHHD